MTTRSRLRRKRVRRTVWWLVSIVVVVALAGVGIGIAASAGVLPFAFADTPSPTPTATTKPVPTLSLTPTAPPPSPPPASPALTSCETHATTVFVAHYDDDLLFANPAIIQALAQGDCVHTVYLTAGDSGRGLSYAKGRETGIFRAYNVMRGGQGANWTARDLTLLTGVHVTELSPEDNPNLTVTLLRLPDGNLNSSGFPATGWQSLAKLYNGSISEMTQIDTGGSVTLASLTATIQELITAYGTNTLITLVPGESGWSGHDHSDHSTTGSIVRSAWQGMGFDPAAVLYAVGYDTAHKPENVFSPDLDIKIDAFMVYAQQDPVSFCDTRAKCLGLHMFGPSLAREYLLTETELFQ
ncbi:hypothetical protein DC31_09420 [Microbacterium sp. CH12i]|uniref:PIG-L family deacetylase n=1 Tax=Microbacterium sp. CH12i TaxID=1479651 RepID=UPI000460EA29|nr:PIG-L family deacetylase [Microbacterium sp. CH12i]KDA06684.1 hypothetical protein DC31_09420 [Microbacterium sp. CH12i]